MNNNIKAVKVYDQIAQAYANEFSKPSDNIDEFLELLPSRGKILDVGCGHGIDVGNSKAKGFSVVGIDLSVEMIKLARSKYPDTDFRVADMRNLDFLEGEFDGIISSCSLIHLEKKDVPKTLRQFFRILKPNGVFYLWILSAKSAEVFVDEPFKPDEKMFVNVMSPEEVEKLLTDAGFEILKLHKKEPDQEGELGFTNIVIIAKKK